VYIYKYENVANDILTKKSAKFQNLFRIFQIIEKDDTIKKQTLCVNAIVYVCVYL